MRRAWVLTAVILISLTQLAAICERIYRYETILARGARHLFPAAPIDPYDAFRGRYVSIALENLSVPIPREEAGQYSSDDKVWVGIVTDADGFSRLAGIHPRRVEGEGLYARVAWAHPQRRPDTEDAESEPQKPPTDEEWEVTFQQPFPNYFMDEGLARKAEDAYRDATRRGERKAWIAVRILDGVGVVEELYIEGKPVREAIGD